FRGLNISNPTISERGFDLNAPEIRNSDGDIQTNPNTGNPYDIIFGTDMSVYNHLTQWTAIVESLDSFKGELFLLVITTVSTVYNKIEGLEYTYLGEKDLYEDDDLGRGKETILNSTYSKLRSVVLNKSDLIKLLRKYSLSSRSLTPGSRKIIRSG
ncbi:MAG: hypothetical protein IIC09_02670, partial [Proteobacteria bacterium]|nr:hypothetical protein [Pseudomonadota bacterium]